VSTTTGAGFDDVFLAYLLGIATACVVAVALVIGAGWSP
jgi:hypothetical protein